MQRFAELFFLSLQPHTRLKHHSTANLLEK